MGGLITIRPFLAEDIAAAAELEMTVGWARWSPQVFVDELAAEGRAYLVAVDQETVVGFAGVMVVGEEAHVTNLLVASGRRRAGIGRRLMSALVDRAVAAGARHLTLEVHAGNTEARTFYASMGLAPVGVRPGYYGDDDALILWAHDIDRPEFKERLG